MALTIPVAHDFCCAWSWIGLHQAKRLARDVGVRIEWLGYELYPEDRPIPARAEIEAARERPATPTRIELAYAAEGMEPPPRPSANFHTHNAHEAVEFAKTLGTGDQMVERIYRAWWMHGLDINSLEVLAAVARGVVPDVEEMLAAIRQRRFQDRIVKFDEDAFATGVYNMPTFFIGGRKYAEQPYRVLYAAVRSLTGQVAEAPPDDAVYANLTFPDAPETRPYTFINMVATIDGKTVSGERTEPVGDIGSKSDHRIMRRIEAAADAVMLGAGSLRSTPGLWYPREQVRIVVTRSGEVDYGWRFFSDAPDRAIVVAPEGGSVSPPAPIRLLAPGSPVSFPEVLRRLRLEVGIERLLIEGGSELNAQLLELDLVDELFLTLAPKIRLGRDVPTYAGGDPLPRERMQRYRLVEQHQVGDEMFLRYRRLIS